MSGTISARGEGTWRLIVDNGRDPLTGRRRRMTKTFHGSRKQAERELERYAVDVHDGQHGTAAATFGQLLDAWLEQIEPDKAAWTMLNYRSKVETHIRPALGDQKLRAVTTVKLDLFYRALLTKGRKTTRRNEVGKLETVYTGLSPQSVRHIHSIVHAACEQARKWGWLDSNPSKLATPPSVPARTHDLPPVAQIVAVGERLTVEMRELVWLAIVSGARRGELCGLRWTDLDLEHGQMTIARSVADTPAELIVKATKTDRVRRLALDALTVDMLVVRRARQTATADACGVVLAVDAYVFGEEPGAAEPLRPMLVTKRWANAARTAQVACRFHDLRHLAVTELLEAGFEVGSVAGRVGHSSPKMTLDVYQHSRRASDLAQSEHLAALLAPK